MAKVNVSEMVVLILTFATLIQFLVDRVKELVGSRVMNVVKAPIWAAVFGILFALMFNIDFFEMFGYTSQMPVVARIITGLILSAGSAGVHELIAKLRESRDAV